MPAIVPSDAPADPRWDELWRRAAYVQRRPPRRARHRLDGVTLHNHPGLWMLGLLAGVLAAFVASMATRVQVLPEVIDVSIIPMLSGLLSLIFTTYGALRRFDPDRLARLSLLGTVLGGSAGLLLLAIGLVVELT
jgi:hypothetical protein